ncbi:MAG: hypothetical protein AB1Z18_00030 [Desulfobacterales bacterium]|jgi:hypothetical protein
MSFRSSLSNLTRTAGRAVLNLDRHIITVDREKIKMEKLAADVELRNQPAAENRKIIWSPAVDKEKSILAANWQLRVTFLGNQGREAK